MANLIKCPHCGKDIEVTEVLTHSIREQMRGELSADLSRKETELVAEQKVLRKQQAELAVKQEEIDEQVAAKVKIEKQKLTDDAIKKAKEEFASQNALLEQELKEKNQKLADAQEKERQLRKQSAELEEKQKNLDLELARRLDVEKTKISEQIRAEATRKAQNEFGAKAKELQEELAEKQAKLIEAQNKEFELRKQQRLLESRQADLELELARKLDEERKKITEDASKKAADQQELKLREKDNLINQMRSEMESLKHKLEKGSQQAQGEALEGQLQDKLSQVFPFDIFEEVKKGVRGADIIQRVRNSLAKDCGVILWETKNTQAFSKEWLTKLKNDQQEAGADIAVIAAIVLPKEISGFGVMDDVWVTDYTTAICLATALRQGLINVARERVVAANQDSMKDIIYRYITGQEFTMQVKGIVTAFARMKNDLDSEKRAIQRMWKIREKQIETVLGNVTGIYSAIEGYVGDKTLPKIEPLMLDTISNEEL